jgi:hypothetical protein
METNFLYKNVYKKHKKNQKNQKYKTKKEEINIENEYKIGNDKNNKGNY